MEVGIKRISQMGGTVRAGCEVVGLVRGNGGRVEAVVLKSGEEVKADVVIVSVKYRIIGSR